MIEIIKSGIITTLSLWRIVLLVYLLQLIVALPIGIQIFHVFESSIGSSLNMNILENGFNRTIFEDFLNVHGSSISPLLGLLRWIIILYLIAIVFIHAGMMHCIEIKNNSLSAFFTGGIKHYIHFFLLAIFFSAIVIFITFCIWGSFLLITDDPITYEPNEKIYFYKLIATAVLYLVLILHVVFWGINSRLSRVKYNSGFLSSIKSGWQILWQNYIPTIGIGVFIGLVHILITGLYWVVSDPVGATMYFIIIALILLQQLTVIIRVGLRMIFYSCLHMQLRS